MKYPRTFHLPFSPGATNDDKVLPGTDHLLGVSLVATEKMDGSGVCMTKDSCFARSHNGPPSHPSFDAFKALHAGVKTLIPDNIYLYGEWCWAKHSIYYDRLPGYFLLFGIKDSVNKIWSSWSGVETWAKKLGVPTVPVVQNNVSFETKGALEAFVTGEAKKISECGQIREGIVIRPQGTISDGDNLSKVAKWVRKNHVQTSDHWKHQEITRNQLRVLA